MSRLSDNSWGKSSVRVSKIHRGDDGDGFSDLSVQVLLQGDVEAAYSAGDNAGVLPTDTMRNTVYGLAQDHLTEDLEAFAQTLVDHFLAKDGITAASVSIEGRRWERAGHHGFVGGSSERRVAEVESSPAGQTYRAGIDGLVVLKTTNSAFSGFPRDEYTILPDADVRLLSTTITTRWSYDRLPADPTVAWATARQEILDHFFTDWSASVQHQGWLMAQAVIDAIPEIAEIEFRLPDQRHLGFALERFGLEDRGVVFHPVSEPYGDIRFKVTR